MGFPVPRYCSEGVAVHFPWPELLPHSPPTDTESDGQTRTLTEREVRSLAGNGFHGAVVGAMMVWMMSTRYIDEKFDQ